MEGVVLYVVLVQVFVKRPKLYMAFFALVSYGEYYTQLAVYRYRELLRSSTAIVS